MRWEGDDGRKTRRRDGKRLVGIWGLKRPTPYSTQICYLFEHEVIKGRIDIWVVAVVRRLSTVGENSNSGHQP